MLHTPRLVMSPSNVSPAFNERGADPPPGRRLRNARARVAFTTQQRRLTAAFTRVDLGLITGLGVRAILMGQVTAPKGSTKGETEMDGDTGTTSGGLTLLVTTET